VDICRKNKNIELVLMDIKMPLMSGLEATKEIKKFKSEIPIVAITSYAYTEDREAAIQSGCVDYIPKPVEISVLQEVLIKYLKN